MLIISVWLFEIAIKKRDDELQTWNGSISNSFITSTNSEIFT